MYDEPQNVSNAENDHWLNNAGAGGAESKDNYRKVFKPGQIVNSN